MFFIKVQCTFHKRPILSFSTICSKLKLYLKIYLYTNRQTYLHPTRCFVFSQLISRSAHAQCSDEIRKRKQRYF